MVLSLFENGLMNFTQYNYFVWAQALKKWTGEDADALGTVLDIGCGDGKWLEELARDKIIQGGIGLDIAVRDQNENNDGRSLELNFQKADFLRPIELPVPTDVRTVCFMNMIYVLPNNEHVANAIREIAPQNLILSVPRDAALDIYEKRHPDKNFRDRPVNAFLNDLGYKAIRQEELCSFYYLANPIAVLACGKSRLLTRFLEDRRRGHLQYYDLIWACPQ